MADVIGSLSPWIQASAIVNVYICAVDVWYLWNTKWGVGRAVLNVEPDASVLALLSAALLRED